MEWKSFKMYIYVCYDLCMQLTKLNVFSGTVLLISLLFCTVGFLRVLCLVLPVSLDCPFLIGLSVFANIFFHLLHMCWRSFNINIYEMPVMHTVRWLTCMHCRCRMPYICVLHCILNLKWKKIFSVSTLRYIVTQRYQVY